MALHCVFKIQLESRSPDVVPFDPQSPVYFSYILCTAVMDAESYLHAEAFCPFDFLRRPLHVSQ